jgi:uncharacterized protein
MTHASDEVPQGSAGKPDGRRRPFRILALDGGGIKGAYTAAFLAGLDTLLGKPIATYFDMIAGTSTGGIIAVALALDVSAKDILSMYEAHGGSIFTRRSRRWWWKMLDLIPNLALSRMRLDRDALRRSRYTAEAMASAARRILGDTTLESAKRRLVVPSVRTSLGRSMVFRTPHFEGQVRDRHLSAVDVILATTAAPTYFPPHWISNEAAQGQYVDGGLWANNPALVAYVEAARIARECTRDVDPQFTPDDIMILSIGTGETPTSFRMNEVRSGVIAWAPHLLSVMMLSQSQGTNRMLRYLLPEENYHRINFVHCGDGWALDSVEKMEILVANGRAEARNLFSRIPPAFWRDEAPPFVRYEVRQRDDPTGPASEPEKRD